ncbi:uncharacterized protein LOC6578411 [Drosophila mojavensis]|uniref:Protein G12 n=1 Tax=Drosophila mojavensis TaxID=7230 RepID=B4KR71_DROMO|nr:uncharacterized protein LOC6578411 [Drosophila mojavensis]EDW08258.1 uncharacterized protein Dmoj_GI19677 [Drosophila mojavensis]
MSKILFAICFALCGASLEASSRRWWPAKLQADPVTYSPELLQDLREFIDLIPSITVDEVVAEHMLTDSGFRKAIKFLRSSDFKHLQQRAESLPEIIEVINFVHLNDTAIRSRILINKSVEQQLRAYAYKSYGYPSITESAFNEEENEGDADENSLVVILVPLNIQQEPKRSTNLNSFVSFAQELLTHLPRDRFVALINEKRKSGTVFPKFYEAIRSDAFKSLLDKTMKSQNVQSLIKTLASHDIDAESLKSIALEVISWGPKI